MYQQYKKYTYLLLFLIISCSDPYAKVEQLETKVIEIHDEVMPKTSTIHSLKKELRASLKVDSDSTTVFYLVKNLNTADEAMKIWMEEYVAADESLSIEANITNLEDQKKKMIMVKDKMLKAIEEASQYLKN